MPVDWYQKMLVQRYSKYYLWYGKVQINMLHCSLKVLEYFFSMRKYVGYICSYKPNFTNQMQNIPNNKEEKNINIFF